MKWKNYNEEDCMYFVTTTLRKYMPLFLDDKIVKIIFDSLSFLRKNKGLKVYAYVVMPEHIHLVVDLFRSEDTQGFRCGDTPKHQVHQTGTTEVTLRHQKDNRCFGESSPPAISRAGHRNKSNLEMSVLIGDFKRFTSRQIAEYLQLESPLLFKKCKAFAYKGQNYAIWQETFRSEVIYKEEFLRQKVDYIHMNPVRRGLVKNPDDWRYSSFNQMWEDDIGDESAFIVDRLVSE